MRLHLRSLLSLMGAGLMAASLGACDDDSSVVEPVTLAAPTGLAAVSTSPTTARVTWNQVAGATAYDLDRASGTGAFSTVGTGLTQTFFEDTGLQAGTQYRYQVRAKAGTAQSPNSAAASVTIAAAGPKVAVLNGVTLNRTLFADTTYVLSGFVKVTNGATLTIQPGTKIVGDTLVAGSSLWITRGAKLVAEGTATQPIVFTSQRAVGSRAPGDWGGIVIIGNAPVNRSATTIFTEGPQGAAENYAGGTNVNDSSGSLKYVRVEFAGYDVSNGGGQELNSISSYAVGRGTTYDYVQSMAGLDDSFEFFGGAVDIRHMVSFESGDDHFDWTEGYQGRGQYLIALQTSVIAPRPGTGTVSSDPRGFEGDGCEIDKAGCTYTNQPTSAPVFANFTAIGPGDGVFSGTDGNGVVVRRGSGGVFVNGIVGRWPGVGVSVRDSASFNLIAKDSLVFRNIVLAQNAANFEAAGRNFGAVLSTNATAWKIVEAQLSNLFGTLPASGTDVTAANLNLQPTSGSAAATAGIGSFAGTPIAARVNGYFGGAMPATAYAGAVDPSGTPWYSGWTNFQRR